MVAMPVPPSVDDLPVSARAGVGVGAEKTTPESQSQSQSQSQWSSTSSAGAELDGFWHDSTALDHFYTTQETTNTLDSFDFNDDGLFFGPFDSCSTGLSDYQTQDSARHMTEASAAGVASFDFAGPDFGAHGLATELPHLQQAEASLDLSSWNHPTAGTQTSSLKDRLNAVVARGDGGRLFIPEDSLRDILSPHSVLDELQRCYFCDVSAQDIQKLAGQITAMDSHWSIAATGLLRMFAVLILLDRADEILDFSREGLSDMSLPMSKLKDSNGAADDQAFELRAATSPSTHLKCFEGWSRHDMSAFERLQWRVVVPVFAEAPNKQVDFLDLDDQAVLPYIASWQNKEHDHFKGGNSEVWKVQVHDAHHRFQSLSSAVPNNHYLAIKKLKSKDEEAFRREVRNLQSLHNAEHPNLLNLLATYKYRGHYHLVFPWADGDLRRLWRSTPSPQAGKEEMRWLAQQCASIASALRSVHAGAESWMQNGGDGPSDKQAMAMNKYGIHGDIKPENIFIFSKGQHKSFKALAMGPPSTASEGSSSTPSASGGSLTSPSSSRSRTQSPAADDCVMTIGDFGGGEFFNRSSNPDPLRQITVAYRPPEYDTKLRPVSRSWDVWGLGCTYLEFVTWFLLGPSGLTEFAKRRTTRTASGKLSDEYFDTFVDANEDGGLGATLKEPVLAWINGLCRHKNASQFIRDFLGFITHRMFIVENASVTRASGAETANFLNELVRKCFDNDDYCVARPATKWGNIESPESRLALPTSATPSDFANLGLDFTATTEDVGASLWHFPSLDDMTDLAQWNTAPIIPTASYASLECTDMLGNWNFTAPVAWNLNASDNPTTSDDKKRKRQIENIPEELDRRVSPKTATSTTGGSSLSPETRRTSSAVDSPVVEASAKKAAEKKFACPYYKNNPLKFRHKRTCCGPGWPTVHRVKEHLYRCHTIGKHTCSRCLKRCKSAAELLAHQRAAVSCDTVTDAFPEGTMLPGQEEVLRVKKRVPPNTTEESRWDEVYMVLFPDADAGSLPTPFYEDDASETRQATNLPGSKTEGEDSSTWFCSPSDYEQYLSNSLPPRVQRELERQVQEEFGFVGDGPQTRRVVDMVQQLQLRLFKQFKQERKAGLAPDGGG